MKTIHIIQIILAITVLILAIQVGDNRDRINNLEGFIENEVQACIDFERY